ncbi:MAG: diadenylate cyclase [Desulfobacteraceae bacterium]|nr:diadenylate cyclase [Desulfobacteraceae bacterium]
MGQFFGIGWQNVLDIALNTYILFRLYVLFRGTNVMRVLLTMVLLLVFRQVALSMGLIITSWLMQGVIAVAALVIIIVFRNEISLVLKSKDFKSFFWGIPRHQLKTPVGIIVESVYEMARKKVGALIVLPLSKGMEGVVQEGITWQGKLSKEMLISIFWPDNPVHDGAVVIQGDRITEVGVILPLSNRTDLPSSFGTRHRAAVGLVEQTDAMVIVVSEERGKITLFRDKQIYDINDSSKFEKLLIAHAGGDTSDVDIKKQTRELAVAATICLVCVTGLWLSFSRGMEALATHDVPIEFISPEDQKMAVFSSSASSVRLLLSGSRPLIRSLTPDSINIKINLTNIEPGTNNLLVSRNAVKLPPGITIRNIEPSELEVIVDVPLKKELPLQPYWTGKLSPDLIMTRALISPEKVRVIGPALGLKKIDTLFTEPLSLDNITQSGSLTANVVMNPATIRIEDNKENRVQVEYTIQKRETVSP